MSLLVGVEAASVVILSGYFLAYVKKRVQLTNSGKGDLLQARYELISSLEDEESSTSGDDNYDYNSFRSSLDTMSEPFLMRDFSRKAIPRTPALRQDGWCDLRALLSMYSTRVVLPKTSSIYYDVSSAAMRGPLTFPISLPSAVLCQQDDGSSSLQLSPVGTFDPSGPLAALHDAAAIPLPPSPRRTRYAPSCFPQGNQAPPLPHPPLEGDMGNIVEALRETCEAEDRIPLPPLPPTSPRTYAVPLPRAPHVGPPCVQTLPPDSWDEDELVASSTLSPTFDGAYVNERVLRVAVISERAGGRLAALPGVELASTHHYVIAVTHTWAYVFEKWCDGVSILRFSSTAAAVHTRGRYFSDLGHGERKNPTLVQEITGPRVHVGTGPVGGAISSVRRALGLRHTCAALSGGVCRCGGQRPPTCAPPEREMGSSACSARSRDDSVAGTAASRRAWDDAAAALASCTTTGDDNDNDGNDDASVGHVDMRNGWSAGGADNESTASRWGPGALLERAGRSAALPVRAAASSAGAALSTLAVLAGTVPRVVAGSAAARYVRPRGGLGHDALAALEALDGKDSEDGDSRIRTTRSSGSRSSAGRCFHGEGGNSVTTTYLIAWALANSRFKKYTDNCHTFAANLADVCGGTGSGILMTLLYDQY